MARELHKVNIILPPSTFFEKRDLWERRDLWYGKQSGKWPELEAALVSFKEFRVVNAETQRHQGMICQLIHTNVDFDGMGIAHWLVWSTGDEADNKAYALLMQGLLQMGAHPDLVAAGNDKWTPSHICASWGSEEVARALVLCRPNLTLKSQHGRTPAAEARNENNLGVAKIFEDAETTGFPTVAQLAEERKWWAVLNLCRRGVIPDKEKLALHNGKDAIAWAMHHQEFAIVEELEYLLKGVVEPKNEGLLDTAMAPLKRELQKINAEKEAMKEESDEQAKHLEQMKVDLAVMKKDGEQLKEMLLLNLTKMNEDHQGLEKKVAALTKEKNSKRKSDLQGLAGDRSFKQLKANGSENALQEEDKCGQADGRVLSNADSNAARNDEKEKVAMLEAENRALKEKFSQLQEAYKTQGALLSSFFNKDV